MAVSQAALIRIREKRFYMFAAVLFALAVVIGFARTYYLKAFFDVPPLSSHLVQIHGGVMSAWVALFMTQVLLVRTKNIRVHQSLGFIGVGLAVLIILSGFFTAIAAGKNGAMSFPPDVPRLSFLAIPIFDLAIFAILFAGAVYYRKKAAIHKRLMLLTAIGFLPPALARFPIPGILELGPLFFFGVPSLVAIFALGYDTWHIGKLNRVFLAGTVLLVASYPLRIVFSGTETWLGFATWLTGFSPV